MAFLFRPFFTFRADRRDFERFDRVYKQYPQFPQIVTALRFEPGVMDIPALAGSLGFEFTQMHNRELLEIQEGKPHDWYQLQEKKDAALQEYASWKVNLDQANQNYADEYLLSMVFSQIYRLDRISISQKDINWNTGNTLLTAWVANETECHHNRIEEEFTSLVLALRRSGHKIKQFSHDQLPVKYIASIPRYVYHNGVFQNLTTLHLTFHATEIPIRKFWNRAGIFMMSIRKLKDLRFGFSPLPKGCVDDGVWYGGDLELDWYVPLSKVLTTFAWPDLESLHLDGMLVCEEGLWTLIETHSGTLSSLVLSDMALLSGSFKSLLQKVRNEMSLKAFWIGGMTRGVHTDIEHWVLPPVYDGEAALWHDGLKRFFKDGETTMWNSETGDCGQRHCLQAAKYPFNCLCSELSSDIQNYVLKKEGRHKWPAKMYNKNTWLSGEKFGGAGHSSKCSTCSALQIERTALFDHDFPEDDIDWEEPYNYAFELDSDGEEIVAHFDDLGYDR